MARFSDKEKLLLKEISKMDCISDIYSLASKIYGIPVGGINLVHT